MDGLMLNKSPIVEKQLALGKAGIRELISNRDSLQGKVSLDLAQSDRLTVDSKDDGSVVVNFIGDNGAALDVTRSASGIIEFTYTGAGKQAFTYISDGENFVIPSISENPETLEWIIG